MPEGPETRHAADRIADAIGGKVIETAYFAFPRLKPWEDRLRGRTVVGVQPRGKAMLVRFDGGVTMVSHNLLYGRWFIRRAGSRPETNRQLRAALDTHDMSALLYSASSIDVLHDEDLPAHPYLSRLGLDPLDPATTPTIVRRRLEDRRFARRSLGALLLDQGFMGGIGNYLRSEILHRARLDPGRRPVDLTPDERMALARAIITMSRRAYRTKGATADPQRVRRAREARRTRGGRPGRPRGRPDLYEVFERAGLGCRRCGEVIERQSVANRRLYRCPGCQV